MFVEVHLRIVSYPQFADFENKGGGLFRPFFLVYIMSDKISYVKLLAIFEPVKLKLQPIGVRTFLISSQIDSETKLVQTVSL